MSRVGIAFLALIVTTSTALAQDPLLLCKINSRGLSGQPLQAHSGTYVGITDWGRAVHLAFEGHNMVLPVLRRDGAPWLLTAEGTEQGATTTLAVLNLPEYDGLTMLIEMVGRNGGAKFMVRGSCKPN